MIDWTEVIISLAVLIITGVIIPLIKTCRDKLKAEIEANTTKEQREAIDDLAEKLVRWAKQHLWTKTGEEKKKQVMKKLVAGLNKLGIDVDYEYLDYVVESIYEQVKKEPEKEVKAEGEVA